MTQREEHRPMLPLDWWRLRLDESTANVATGIEGNSTSCLSCIQVSSLNCITTRQHPTAERLI